jgi:hypothetical protein
LPPVSDLRLTPITGAERLVTLHAAELPQKNDLCGAFWGTLALRLAGITGDGEPIDQDAVGMAAGSVIPATSDDEALPPGETGRTDYRLSFPTVADSARSGTSVDGLVRAIRSLSGDSLAVIPVAGPWSAPALDAVLDAATACTQPCTTIANLSTRHLWGSRASPAALIGYLTTGDAALGPAPDWDVGHFVGVLGRIHGPRGTLVIVADTYRSLGWDGLHVQPSERMADGLARIHSGRPSGIVLVASADDAPALERRIGAAGLQIGTWDNGSPDMAATAG